MEQPAVSSKKSKDLTNDATQILRMLRLGETDDDAPKDTEDIIMSFPADSEGEMVLTAIGPRFVQENLLFNSEKCSSYTPISILPSEILRMIFEYTLPPPFLLSHSLSLGPSSPWCQAIQMKRDIVSVSRQWWDAGIHILYKDVTIRRLSQLRALRATLESNKFGACTMVQTLAITLVILDPDEDEAVFCSDLSVVFRLCDNLRSLNYDPHDLMESPYIATERWTFAASRISENITHLELGDRVQMASILLCLKQHSPRLEYLSFYPPQGSIPDDTLFADVSLPSLEVLSCGVKAECIPALCIMAKHWRLPHLRRLTFTVFRRYNGNLLLALENFTRQHGQKLKYLHILDKPTHSCYYDAPPYYVWGVIDHNSSNEPERSPTVMGLQALITHCPALEHLVIPVHTDALDTGIPLSHPTVKWIDAWWNRWPTPEWSQILAQEQTEASTRLPALRRVRCLDKGLLNSAHWDMPFLLPPEELSPGDHLNYFFPGLHIVNSWNEIYHPDMEIIEEYGDMVIEMENFPVSSDEEDMFDGSLSAADNSDSDTETSYSSFSDFP